VQNVAEDWQECVRGIATVLQDEEKLLEIVQLVGNDALPEKQQATLLVARLIREGFLQQNAFHDVDTTCSLAKSYRLMKALLYFHKLALRAVEQGARTSTIAKLTTRDALLGAKYEADDETFLRELTKRMDDEFLALAQTHTHAHEYQDRAATATETKPAAPATKTAPKRAQTQTRKSP
jgi:V/A-type H+-transporting ATPase subunit A